METAPRIVRSGPRADDTDAGFAPFRNPKDAFLQVFVRDNNVDMALRVLKKKMQREGVFREMRRRRFYQKPSEEAARRRADAVRRRHKLARKQAIRDGLIAAPPRKKKEETKRPGHRDSREASAVTGRESGVQNRQ